MSYLLIEMLRDVEDTSLKPRIEEERLAPAFPLIIQIKEHASEIPRDRNRALISGRIAEMSNIFTYPKVGASVAGSRRDTPSKLVTVFGWLILC